MSPLDNGGDLRSSAGMGNRRPPHPSVRVRVRCTSSSASRLLPIVPSVPSDRTRVDPVGERERSRVRRWMGRGKVPRREFLLYQGRSWCLCARGTHPEDTTVSEAELQARPPHRCRNRTFHAWVIRQGDGREKPAPTMGATSPFPTLPTPTTQQGAVGSIAFAMHRFPTHVVDWFGNEEGAPSTTTLDDGTQPMALPRSLSGGDASFSFSMRLGLWNPTFKTRADAFSRTYTVVAGEARMRARASVSIPHSPPASIGRWGSLDRKDRRPPRRPIHPYRTVSTSSLLPVP